MSQKITIGNVCFLFNQNKDKVLLLKRNRFPMQGMWTGVGGKTDLNEDIKISCMREIKEETNFNVRNAILKGVIKTILHGTDSSWLLFVYTAMTKEEKFHKCNEGKLEWVSLSKIADYKLIGFIKEIFPYLLENTRLIEGTIFHNERGDVIKKILHI